MRISIISSSTRKGRVSHRIALCLHAALQKRGHQSQLIDLLELQLPPFTERFASMEKPETRFSETAQILADSQAFIFLSPEYNGAISSGLKNFIDFYAKDPFMHKPIGVATGSTGAMGGIRAAYQLQQNILTSHGFPHPQMLNVGKMDQVLNEKGEIQDPAFSKKLNHFLDLFLNFAQKLSA